MLSKKRGSSLFTAGALPMPDRIPLLSDHEGICFVVKQVFSKEFCERTMRRVKPQFVSADTHYPTTYRNNNRYVSDDALLADWLFETAKEYVPSSIIVDGIASNESGHWRPTGLNSRVRFCEYLPAQAFNKHLDGIHYESKNVQSKLTFIVYLNGSECFGGGRTLFFRSREDPEILQSYKPEQGDLIIFDHNIWHSGEEVTSGAKYILRSDILFERVKYSLPALPEWKERRPEFSPGHLGYVWTVKKFRNTLITAGRDQKIKQWTTSGSFVHEFNAHSNSIIAILVMSHDIVLSASRDQLIKVWHCADGEFSCRQTLSIHEAAVLHLCKLSDTCFASCGADGRINICDLSGNLLKSWVAHREWIWSAVKLDSHLISAGADGMVKLWRHCTVKEAFTWQSANPITSMVLLPSGSRFCTGDHAGKIVQFRYCRESVSFSPEIEREAHSGTIRALNASEDYLVSASEDGFVKVWALKDLTEVFRYTHNNFVQDALIDASHVFSVSYDGRIKRKAIASFIAKSRL